MTTPIVLYGAFVASKVGKTGLSPTVNVRSIERATGTVTSVASGAAAFTVGDGVYGYQVAEATPQTHDYLAVFITSDATVDAQHVQAVWPPLAGAWAVELAAVLTRLAASSYTAPPSAASVADAVADEVMADHTVPGSLAVLVSAAGSAADPLMNIVPGNYPTGSGGDALGRIASGQLTIVQMVLADGYVRIVPGDDYIAAIGTAIDITGDGWPDISAAAITWIFGETELTGSAVDADTVRLELTSAQSTALGEDDGGQGYYDVIALIPTDTPGESYRVTLVRSARRLVG